MPNIDYHKNLSRDKHSSLFCLSVRDGEINRLTFFRSQMKMPIMSYQPNLIFVCKARAFPLGRLMASDQLLDPAVKVWKGLTP
jgi:hypothetical protein